MRLIGSLPDEEQAKRFGDYLLSRKVHTTVEADGDAWDIWVHDEDQVTTAKEELSAFRESPDDERFLKAIDEAQVVRKTEKREFERAAKNRVSMRDRWSAPAHRRVPVTFALIMLSILVTIVTNFGKDENDLQQNVFASNVEFKQVLEGEAAHFDEVWRGEVWRLVTPIFVHLSILHLLFNMFWLWTFGQMIEMRFRWGRFLFLVLSIAIICNVAQTIASGPKHGGMSGVLYGFFGYAWVKSRLDPRSGIVMPQSWVLLLMGWFFLCFTGLLGPIGNTAHAAGLASGIVIAYVPLAWKNRS